MIFFRNMTARERNAIIITVSVVSAALIYNFILEPSAAKWQGLSAEIASKKVMLERSVRILSSYKSLESDYSRFSAYIKSQDDEEKSLADLLSYIETVSRGNSCLIFNIKPMGTKSQPPYREILIEITAEANMDQYSKFLYEIENTKNMILRIRRFTISSKYGQADTLKGTFLISKILVGR